MSISLRSVLIRAVTEVTTGPIDSLLDFEIEDAAALIEPPLDLQTIDLEIDSMERVNKAGSAGHGGSVRHILRYFTFVALFVFMAQAAAADAPKTRLFLNLTSDDVWTSQMAFGYANKAMDLGHDLVVFLNVRAVTLAHRSLPQPVESQRQMTARDELKALMARGARVFVCPSCTAQAGMSPDDWIEGVEAGGPELIALQMDPQSKVLSY